MTVFVQPQLHLPGVVSSNMSTTLHNGVRACKSTKLVLSAFLSHMWKRRFVVQCLDAPDRVPSAVALVALWKERAVSSAVDSAAHCVV